MYHVLCMYYVGRKVCGPSACLSTYAGSHGQGSAVIPIVDARGTKAGTMRLSRSDPANLSDDLQTTTRNDLGQVGRVAVAVIGPSASFRYSRLFQLELGLSSWPRAIAHSLVWNSDDVDASCWDCLLDSYTPAGAHLTLRLEHLARL